MLKKGVKGVLIGVGVLLVFLLVLVLMGKINVFPQLALSTPSGDLDLNCDSYATCSPLLKDMGYSDVEVDMILTSCNSEGCRVMS